MSKPFSVAFKQKMVERLTGKNAVSATQLTRETPESTSRTCRGGYRRRVVCRSWPTDRSRCARGPSSRKRVFSPRCAISTAEELTAYLEREDVTRADYEQWRLALDEGGAASTSTSKRIRQLERELARKMMGSRMSVATDACNEQAIGSRVEMRGRLVGFPLSLAEVVTERQPPTRKAWETVDTNLLVVGPYRLGFELTPADAGSCLRVFIDYDLPPDGPGRWLGKLFGKAYARWCTERVAKDATAHFTVG